MKNALRRRCAIKKIHTEVKAGGKRVRGRKRGKIAQRSESKVNKKFTLRARKKQSSAQFSSDNFEFFHFLAERQ